MEDPEDTAGLILAYGLCGKPEPSYRPVKKDTALASNLDSVTDLHPATPFNLVTSAISATQTRLKSDISSKPTHAEEFLNDTIARVRRNQG